VNSVELLLIEQIQMAEAARTQSCELCSGEGMPVDVLEDFIVKDGMPVASLTEFKQWLEHCIDAIVEENSPG